MDGNFDDARIARDRYGRPLTDRYGRPIYRRAADEVPPRAQRERRPLPQHSAERRPRPGQPRPRPARPEQSPREPGPRRPVAPQRPAPGPRHRAPAPSEPAPATRAWDAYQHPDDPRFPPPGYQPEQPQPQTPPARARRRGAVGNQQAIPRPPAGRRRRAAQPAPRRRPRLRLRTLAFVVVLVLVATMVMVDLSLNRVTTFANLAGRPSNTMATNWLLVGSDSRQGLTEEDSKRLATGNNDVGQRTDTIMIAHIPLVGRPKLVSIPRDSYVEIPGYGTNKINAAFSFGGSELLVDTVEKTTGVHIDHYAEIGFGGFAGVVDAAGGVELCPAEPIDDPLAGINLQAGCQQMDGATALGYVRTRATAAGDLDRVERQREFMSALFSRLSSPRVWLNPYRWLRLAIAGTQAVVVGDGDHVWHLSWLMLRMFLGSESLTVPTAGTMDTGEAGNVLLWDEVAAADLFQQLR